MPLKLKLLAAPLLVEVIQVDPVLLVKFVPLSVVLLAACTVPVLLIEPPVKFSAAPDSMTPDN